MVQRDGASVHAVKTVSVVAVCWDDAVSSAHCAQGLCMLCVRSKRDFGVVSDTLFLTY